MGTNKEEQTKKGLHTLNLAERWNCEKGGRKWNLHEMRNGEDGGRGLVRGRLTPGKFAQRRLCESSAFL